MTDRFPTPGRNTTPGSSRSVWPRDLRHVRMSGRIGPVWVQSGLIVVIQNGCPAGSRSTHHRTSGCGSTLIAPSLTALADGSSRSEPADRSRWTTEASGQTGGT